MPLPDDFWEVGDGAVVGVTPVSRPSFRKVRELIGSSGTPTAKLIINKGDQLRISWPAGPNHQALLVSVNGRHTFGLVVGWTSPTTATVRWLPLYPTLLRMVRAIYEDLDPRVNDITLKRDTQGRWGYESPPDCNLSMIQTDDSAWSLGVQDRIKRALQAWPGTIISKGWY